MGAVERQDRYNFWKVSSLSMYLPVIYSKATWPQYPGTFWVQMDSEGPELGYSLSKPSTCPDRPLLLAALMPASFNLSWIKTCRFSRWCKWEAAGEFWIFVISSKRSIGFFHKWSPKPQFWEVISGKLNPPHFFAACVQKGRIGFTHNWPRGKHQNWGMLAELQVQTFAETRTISPICISYVCLLTHYKGWSCSLFTHQVFPSPSRANAHKANRQTFHFRELVRMRAGLFRLPFTWQDRAPTTRSGARHICSGFHSCGRWFSYGRRAIDGHLTGGDGEERSGLVSRDWLEHQLNGDRPPVSDTNPALFPKGGGGDSHFHTVHLHLCIRRVLY